MENRYCQFNVYIYIKILVLYPMKLKAITNTAIVVLILSTILFSCASRKNKRASKELKSPTVEVVQENKEIPQQEGSIIAVTSAPKQEEPVAQEKPKPIEKKAVVEAPLRVDLP